MFKHVLIPTDGSAVGNKAVKEGVELARALKAKVTILTVLQPFHVYGLGTDLVAEPESEHRRPEDEEHELEDTRLAQEAAESFGVHAVHVTAEDDHLSQAVINVARSRGCDLVVMPAHDRIGLLGRSHIDSETIRLLAESELPVLVLH
jgi:nucleotide-binding universal stress UspA family protein